MEKDWKKEVQRLLDVATEETAQVLNTVKVFLDENKDKVSKEVVKEKVSEATDAVVAVWKKANDRLNEFANDPKVADKMDEYRVMFKEAYGKVSASVVETYASLKENQEIKEKFNEAGELLKSTAEKLAEKVADVYKEVTSEEKVQEVVGKLKEVTDKGMDVVKEKMNDPKVQETVDRLKDGAKDVAEKATEQLKKLFKKEEAAEDTKE